MFDMGMWEILLIFVILLIVVGPERLPKLARTLGLWVNKARNMVSSVRSEVERELRVEELRQSIKEQTESEQFRKLSDEVKSFGDDVRGVEREMRSSADRDTAQVGDSVRSAKTGESSGSGTEKPATDKAVTPDATSEHTRDTSRPQTASDTTDNPSTTRTTATTAAERGSE